MSRSPARSWLAGRAHDYGLVVTALCLNLPFLAVALARHLDGVSALSLAGAYVDLVILGYYALLVFAAVSLVFAATLFSRRLAVLASAAVLFGALLYLVLNGIVHAIYRFHIDAFWLQYVFTSYRGLGLPPSMILLALGIAASLAALEWVLFRVAARIRRRGRVGAAFVAAAAVSFVASQAIHIVAYHKNDTRITGITPHLPFYFPVTSHGNAVKYGDLVPLVGETADASRAGPSMRYPLAEVPCPPPRARRPNVLIVVLESWRFDMLDPVVTPHLHALGRRSSTFLRHFSSGNATPTGIFGLFYGLHPTYWTAVKANGAAIDNPLLVDQLEAAGYRMGIYADSDFDRHKIRDTVFRGIPIHEDFAGATADLKDADMTARLTAFIEESHAARRPFLGFAFYKSTHYNYHYPREWERFRPAAELNIALAGNPRDAAAYLNDYRNSVRWVDELIGRLLQRLEALGLMDETVVVVTSDHGEEFNDNGANYWGHCGNFTRWQTQVPLILHAPGRPPRRIEELTTHVDVPTTLLQEVFGCDRDPRTYSNGRNLFEPLGAPRPLIVAGYVNHAFVLGDDVFAVHPMMVQGYKLGSITAAAGPPRPDLVRAAMEEMQRFLRPREAWTGVARAGAVGR